MFAIKTKLDKFVHGWHQWLRKIEISHRVRTMVTKLQVVPLFVRVAHDILMQ